MRLQFSSPFPGVCSSSCSLSRWCHPTISSFAAPFSSCLQSFPASGSSPMIWFFASDCQTTGALASASVLPMNAGMISFRINWFDLLAVQGTFKSLLPCHSSKASVLQRWAFFMVQLSHPYLIIGKTIALTTWTFISKVIPLLFKMLSRFVPFFPGVSVF